MFGSIKRLKVRAKLFAFVGLFAVGFVSLGLLTASTISTVAVNGPIYREIVQGKDLVADILPPPEYIIESYLVVLQIAGESNHYRQAAMVDRLKKLEEDYVTRHAYWQEPLEAGEMKDTLLHKSYAPAMEFYAQVKDKFIPAVYAGDKAQVRELAYGSLKEKYEAHRLAIDRVVTLAYTRNSAIEQRAAGLIRNRGLMLIGFGLGTLLLCGFVALRLIRGITQPLQVATGVVRRLAEGELYVETASTESARHDEFGEMLRAMQDMSAKLAGVISEIRTSSDAVGSAAKQISAGSSDLSERTQDQASALEETASSMVEMTSTVKANADNARQASQLAAGARDQAEKGGEVVSKAVSAMAEINTSSKKIADIISVIDEIAFQTNLLALNAAVEAARAGEEGRGFAVVATEVRNLAQRSAAAAKEIKDLIKDSVEKVEAGSGLVDESGRTLTEIVESVKKVTDFIAEIAAASEEQSVGIEQVNKAVMQMDEVTQQNAALVQEAAAASKAMEEQAEHMVNLVSFFKTGTHAPAPRAAAKAEAAHRDKPKAVARAPVRLKRTAHPAPGLKAAKEDEGEQWKEF
jgi:methyl-accepting chemotaxis protein